MINSETLFKVLAVYNKQKYCLVVWTRNNIKGFDLYLMKNRVTDFLDINNKPILSSDCGDTVEELINYLKKHDGFSKKW